MKIKTFIFLFFVLMMLFSVSAKKEIENPGNPDNTNGDVEPPPEDEINNNNNNGGDNGNNGSNNGGGNGNNNGGGNGGNGGNGGGEETSPSSPKETNPPKDTNPSKEPAATSTPGNNAKSTPLSIATSTKKIEQQPVTTIDSKPAATIATSASVPTPVATQDNGTPTPTIDVKAENVMQKGVEGNNWGKIGLIGGGIIGVLFVIGIVFNFINKRKSSDNIDNINFVVDNQAPEPEMSTSMFNQQNDMYGQPQNQGYQDYDMQYGQYNDQYNQADPYSQGYAQDVNFAQRTLSLNRNPSANAQNYQVDENAREVIYNHRPEAGDEIELRRGDQATIYEKYEDGWAWGYNITTGKTGMFPQQCLA